MLTILMSFIIIYYYHLFTILCITQSVNITMDCDTFKYSIIILMAFIRFYSNLLPHWQLLLKVVVRLLLQENSGQLKSSSSAAGRGSPDGSWMVT